MARRFQSSCATAANRQQVGSHSFRLTLLQNSGQTFPQSFRNGISVIVSPVSSR